MITVAKTPSDEGAPLSCVPSEFAKRPNANKCKQPLQSNKVTYLSISEIPAGLVPPLSLLRFLSNLWAVSISISVDACLHP